MQKSRNLKFDQANKLVQKNAKKQLACHVYRNRANHLYVDNEVNIENVCSHDEIKFNCPFMSTTKVRNPHLWNS